jgi:prepilin-type N-terminal cleavage/methylation domain-containing protein
MRNRDHGFTLIEVLGAIAILAILYTTLSTVAIQWLRSEGESRRMLEASLAADWELSEFELELDQGVAPEIGITESETENGLKVTWEVTPLQTKIFKTALEKQQERDAANPAAPPLAAPAAQAASTEPIAPPFLQVDLRVAWFEAGSEHSITRTLFAVDEDAAAKLAATGVLSATAPEVPQP